MALSPLHRRARSFIDTETTGLDPSKHELLEISILREKSPPTHAEYDMWITYKIKPERIEDASPQALKINGYTPEDWVDAVPFAEVAEEIAALLTDCLVVGHNVDFDLNFINAALRRAGVEAKISYHKLDTTTLAYEHLHQKGLDSLSLASVCKHLGVTNAGAHTASADVYRCREAFYKLTQGVIDTPIRKSIFWYAVHNVVAHPLMVLPFEWTQQFHDWTAARM